MCWTVTKHSLMEAFEETRCVRDERSPKKSAVLVQSSSAEVLLKCRLPPIQEQRLALTLSANQDETQTQHHEVSSKQQQSKQKKMRRKLFPESTTRRDVLPAIRNFSSKGNLKEADENVGSKRGQQNLPFHIRKSIDNYDYDQWARKRPHRQKQKQEKEVKTKTTRNVNTGSARQTDVTRLSPPDVALTSRPTSASHMNCCNYDHTVCSSTFSEKSMYGRKSPNPKLSVSNLTSDVAAATSKAKPRWQSSHTPLKLTPRYCNSKERYRLNRTEEYSLPDSARESGQALKIDAKGLRPLSGSLGKTTPSIAEPSNLPLTIKELMLGVGRFKFGDYTNSNSGSGRISPLSPTGIQPVFPSYKDLRAQLDIPNSVSRKVQKLEELLRRDRHDPEEKHRFIKFSKPKPVYYDPRLPPESLHGPEMKVVKEQYDFEPPTEYYRHTNTPEPDYSIWDAIRTEGRRDFESYSRGKIARERQSTGRLKFVK